MTIEFGDFMYFIADVFGYGVRASKRTIECNFFTQSRWENDLVNMAVIYAQVNNKNPHDYDAIVVTNTTINPYSSVR